MAIKEGRFDKRPVPVYNVDGTLALDREEFPRPGTTVESLWPRCRSSFEALADIPLDEDGTTYRSLVLQKFPGLEITHVHHAGNSSGVVDGAAALLLTTPRVRHGARHEAAGPDRGHGEHGRRSHADVERPGPGHPQGPRQGRPGAGRHRPVRGQRGLRRRRRRSSSATSTSTARRSTSTAAPSRSATPSAPPARFSSAPAWTSWSAGPAGRARSPCAPAAAWRRR